MIRLMILFAVAAACAVPANAQRVFRASSIDLEQNERLAELEAKVAALEVKAELASVIAAATPARKPARKPARNQAAAKAEPPPDGKVVRPVSVATSQPSVPVVQSNYVTAPVTVVKSPGSNRKSTAELRAEIQRQRPGGWRGPVYADVSPRSWAGQHLQSDHGFSALQVSGLTQNERLILHDLAHAGRVSPYRSSSTRAVQAVSYTSTPAVTYSATPSRATASRSYSSGCPNGQCPTSRSTRARTRTRLFPRLFGR